MYEFQFDDDDYEMYDVIYAENPIKILVDEEFDRDWSPSGRRPYYQMRGKRISEQQAFEIICRTDRMFSHYALNFENSICSLNFHNDWFLGDYFSRYGWVHPNGIIGTNGITLKYPTVDEFAHEWAVYLHSFPFLDLIIGITWWDEVSPRKWKMLRERCKNRMFDVSNEMKYLEYNDFCNNIEAGIWVHDGRIEIIDREQTIEVYKKYEKLYEEKDHRIYCHEYYEDFQPDVTTLEYLKKCLLTYGITDAEEFLKQKLRPNELEKIKKYGLIHKQPAP